MADRPLVATDRVNSALLADARRSTWVTATLRAFRKNPNLAIGFGVLVFASTVAIFAPLIDRPGPFELAPFDRLLGPSGEHWFGTDDVGRDVYARTVHGARISLLVAFSFVFSVTIVGMVIGVVAGYNRRADGIIMRFMDGLMAIPGLLLAMALLAMLGPSIRNVIIAIAVGSTPNMVRVVRSSVLSLRDQPFVEAARAVGDPPWRILMFHVAPNTLAPVTVQATFLFAAAILTEAGLSFIGAGIPPFIPSWGNIISDGRNFLQIAFWIVFFPGTFLALTVLAVNLVGDGIRDAVDPKLRRSV